MRPMLLLFVLLVIGTPAQAVRLDADECALYAIWSRDLVWARDVKADKEATRASLIEMNRPPEPVFVLLLRDLDALWQTKEARGDVLSRVYRDCMRRHREYGEAL